MRLYLSLSLLALFVTGCSHQGVIVQKESRPHPFYHSLGVEGMYAFLLKDNAGGVHRQMVTPEVFESYTEGDYFNDLQPGPAGGGADPKTMRTASRSASSSADRMASRAKVSRSLRVAGRSVRARKLVAKQTVSERKGQLVHSALPSTTDLTVANTTVIRKKSSAATPAKKRSKAAVAVRKPAPLVKKAMPEVNAPSPKIASVPTPVLATTGAGTAEDPAVVFMPPRVR